MYKFRLSIIVLNLISIVGLTVFILFTYLQINNLQPKFGLDNHYVEFNLLDNSYRPSNNNREEIVFREIRDILYDEMITIINYDVSKMGLGVYDSNNKYQSINLLKGYNIDYKSFNNHILLKNNSYFISENTIKSLRGNSFQITGYYDDAYPLFNENTEYIYNIFAEPTVNGEFYLETENQELINNIFNVFRAQDYTINIIQTNHSILSLLGYSLYSSSLLGIFFIYLNLFIFYFYYYENIKRKIKIHILYGAEYKDLILFNIKNFTFNMTLGSIIGSFLYYILFRNSLLNKNIYFISLLLNSTINIILFIICLWLKKSSTYNSLVK